MVVSWGAFRPAVSDTGVGSAVTWTDYCYDVHVFLMQQTFHTLYYTK